MINEITIPSEYVDVAGRWYDGMDMLYAVCSTGGLTTGTTCPVRDYDGREDRDRKWYYGLWLSLSADVGCARRAASKLVDGFREFDPDSESRDEWESEYDELQSDFDTLTEFEVWVDRTISDLESEYPELEDWSGE